MVAGRPAPRSIRKPYAPPQPRHDASQLADAVQSIRASFKTLDTSGAKFDRDVARQRSRLFIQILGAQHGGSAGGDSCGAFSEDPEGQHRARRRRGRFTQHSAMQTARHNAEGRQRPPPRLDLVAAEGGEDASDSDRENGSRRSDQDSDAKGAGSESEVDDTDNDGDWQLCARWLTDSPMSQRSRTSCSGAAGAAAPNRPTVTSTPLHSACCASTTPQRHKRLSSKEGPPIATAAGAGAATGPVSPLAFEGVPTAACSHAMGYAAGCAAGAATAATPRSCRGGGGRGGGAGLASLSSTPRFTVSVAADRPFSAPRVQRPTAVGLPTWANAAARPDSAASTKSDTVAVQKCHPTAPSRPVSAPFGVAGGRPGRCGRAARGDRPRSAFANIQRRQQRLAPRERPPTAPLCEPQARWMATEGVMAPSSSRRPSSVPPTPTCGPRFEARISAYGGRTAHCGSAAAT